MKKENLLLFAFAATIVSCGGNFNEKCEQTTDWEKQKLNGPVKNLVEVSMPAQEKADGSFETFEFILNMEDCREFNENGFETFYSHTYNGQIGNDYTIGAISLMTDKKEERSFNNQNQLVYEKKWSKFQTVENETTTEIEYQDDGLTLKYKKETEGGSARYGINVRQEYFYDGKGNLKERIKSRSAGIFKEDQYNVEERSVFQNHYNSKNLLTEVEHELIKYKHSRKEEPDSVITKNNRKYTYDSKGKNRIEEKYSQDGEFYYHYLYEYDKDDRVIKFVILNENGTEESVESKVFDKNGELISLINNGGEVYKSKITYKNGQIIRQEESENIFEYDEFDANRNWTLCRVYDKYNRIQLVKKRRINYY